MTAGLSPACPDSGGASAAALALGGNHKDVLRLFQKSCPGVPLTTIKKGMGDASSLVSDFPAASARDKARRGRHQRSAIGISLDAERSSANKVGRGGASARGVEDDGTQLLEAARVGDTETMRKILAKGQVGVEWMKRSNGRTAVMEAAENGSLQSVCFLGDMG